MPRSGTLVELRKHPRARLSLPARIRWHGPLGMRLEESRTIDLSREGLLLHRNEPCQVGARIWVAYPFDSAATEMVEPETPARTVRVESDPAGGFRVAVQLLLPPKPRRRPLAQERRRSSRLALALPVFIRTADCPWAEECMSEDVSQGGARLETSQICTTGNTVRVRIPWGEWANAREMTGRVLRVQALEEPVGAATVAGLETGASATLSRVAVEWLDRR